MSHKNTPWFNKNFAVVAVAILLIVGGTLLYTRRYFNNSTPATGNPQPSDTINLEPATEEDKIRAEQNKQAIVDREQQLENQHPTPGKKAVTPTITYAGQYGSQVEVGGYVNGIFEDGGTCTATFSQGPTSFNKSVSAVKGANSVDCPVMVAKNEEFSQKGNWNVVVAYNSITASGSSDGKTIEIR